MQDCIFCKIVAGEIPSYRVFENDEFLGFLDVYPKVKGHTLIIPKSHHRWVYEVPNFTGYWEAARKVTAAMQKTLEPAWINYFTYGAVPHAHIHILPRMEPLSAENADSQVVPAKTLSFTKEEFTSIAELIASGL